MYTRLCQEFINMLPHASALFAISKNAKYTLVECNEAFREIFDVHTEYSDSVSDIQLNQTEIRKSLICGIDNMIKCNNNQFIQDQSNHTIVINKISLPDKEYLIVLIVGLSEKIQSTIKNYEFFYDSIGDMILVSNQDGRILFSNNAVTKNLGYTKEELKTMHVLELHPKEKRKEAETIFADMFYRERDVCPLPLAKKDGQYVPVETRIWFGEWDGVECIFSLSKDLSAEQEALQKFTRLFERNPACISIASVTTRSYLQVNEAFLRTLGFSKNEVLGRTANELGILVDAHAYDQRFDELMIKDHISDTVINVRKKTGEILVALFSSEMIESQGDRFILNVMIDITEQKEAELKLAKKSELQELLIELSSRYINCSLDNIKGEIQNSLERVGQFINADRVYIFDYNFNTATTSNTFEWCNTSIEPQIEYLQDVPIAIIPDWIESHIQGETIVIQDVSTLSSKVSAVKDILEPQGVKSLVTIPMIFEGRCLGFVGFDSVKATREYADSEIDLLRFYTQILANIHIRKDHEEELRLARVKAEKATEAKNYFIAKTSHELRNPLNGAWGFMNLLKESIQSGTEKEYILNSINSLGNAIRIADDLIDIAKIENNELNLKYNTIDMASLVNESIFSYMGEIESNGLELKIKLDGNVPLNLIGDSIRIKQIIGNLLKNAIVHANANTIEIGCKVATLESDMTSLIFHVKDDGVGVSSENQEHIFDLFYKAENNSAGAGLGLAVCKELVERMGGEIWIESGKEGGSTFYFTLPFRIEKVQKADVRAGDGKSVQGLSGLRILLAEDNIINQALIKEMLKRKEMWVTAVGNGAEVLRALENDHYDLVLMDIQMPIMDGLITTKRIRESQNPIPIIALTASVMLKEKEQFIKNGMNGVVEKPVFIDALLKEINLQVAR